MADAAEAGVATVAASTNVATSVAQGAVNASAGVAEAAGQAVTNTTNAATNVVVGAVTPPAQALAVDVGPTTTTELAPTIAQIPPAVVGPIVSTALDEIPPPPPDTHFLEALILLTAFSNPLWERFPWIGRNEFNRELEGWADRMIEVAKEAGDYQTRIKRYSATLEKMFDTLPNRALLSRDLNTITNKLRVDPESVSKIIQATWPRKEQVEAEARAILIKAEEDEARRRKELEESERAALQVRQGGKGKRGRAAGKRTKMSTIPSKTQARRAGTTSIAKFYSGDIDTTTTTTRSKEPCLWGIKQETLKRENDYWVMTCLANAENPALSTCRSIAIKDDPKVVLQPYDCVTTERKLELGTEVAQSVVEGKTKRVILQETRPITASFSTTSLEKSTSATAKVQPDFIKLAKGDAPKSGGGKRRGGTIPSIDTQHVRAETSGMTQADIDQYKKTATLKGAYVQVDKKVLDQLSETPAESIGLGDLTLTVATQNPWGAAPVRLFTEGFDYFTADNKPFVELHHRDELAIACYLHALTIQFCEEFPEKCKELFDPLSDTIGTMRVKLCVWIGMLEAVPDYAERFHKFWEKRMVRPQRFMENEETARQYLGKDLSKYVYHSSTSVMGDGMRRWNSPIDGRYRAPTSSGNAHENGGNAISVAEAIEKLITTIGYMTGSQLNADRKAYQAPLGVNVADQRGFIYNKEQYAIDVQLVQTMNPKPIALSEQNLLALLARLMYRVGFVVNLRHAAFNESVKFLLDVNNNAEWYLDGGKQLMEYLRVYYAKNQFNAASQTSPFFRLTARRLALMKAKGFGTASITVPETGQSKEGRVYTFPQAESKKTPARTPRRVVRQLIEDEL